jgi:hypothetical protein
VTRAPARSIRMADIEAARSEPGATALLMLTDRCPVGCAHCSVDSRPDSPVITDRALFEQIVTGLCADRDRWLVGISGGEPFVERWALPFAVRALAGAGKAVAVLTSGNWGTDPVPRWIAGVLADLDTVIVSTDVYHRAGLADDRFVGALRAAAAAGCWVVVQCLDDDESLARAHALIADALGPDAAGTCEIAPIRLLRSGRAQDLVPVSIGRPGRSFGTCPVLEAPVVRYDGTVVPCCNEDVTMGAGPAALRSTVAGPDGLAAELDRIRTDPLLESIRHIGLGALTELPAFADLAEARFTSICELCFAMHDRVARPDARRQVEAAAIVAAASKRRP